MKLVEVTCELGSPAIVDPEPLHFDGVLFGPMARLMPQAQLDAGAFPVMPICSAKLFCEEVLLASAATVRGEYAADEITMTKRRDGVDLQHIGGPIHLGLGPGKNKMRRGAGIIGTLRWLAICGRMRPLRKVLQQKLMALGRELASGHGRIKRWTVSEADESLPLIRCLIDEDGKAARSLPPTWCSSAERLARGRFRPPYWHSHEQVVPVGARVTLREEVVRDVERLRDVQPKRRR